ncbi:MAG: SDR family NAD(P)-dependent oxidoreductase [Balneolales bacterium]|nr:SDR family NAD(P)-dependent oxidoreductase [Balneolales bacterium]
MAFSRTQRSNFQTKYGPWAVVTGASSGIGKELALRIAENGIHTILVARNTDRLTALKSQIRERYNVKAEIVTADLADNGVQEVITSVRGKDIGLFVGAAGFGTSGLLLENSIHEELNMLDVNCSALLALTHHFAQAFSLKKRGGIILLSSIVAFQGVPYATNYAATKAYVQSLAEGLYHELKLHHVDVLAAAPGPVITGFGERANMQMGNALKPEAIALPILKALGKKRTVLPGLLTKILTYSLKTVPRWGKTRIMMQVMKGMTRHQR